MISLAIAIAAEWKTDSARIILHRAASLAAPENTVPALEAAYRQGADGVEIDVRRTLDGAFVLYHDDWILRPYGPSVKIEDLTLPEVGKIDVGERWGRRWAGLRAPLLVDVFRFAQKTGLLLQLDIKTPGIRDEVLAIARTEGVESQVLGDSVTPLPWIQGWNYTSGGEEDPAAIAAAIKRQPTATWQAMADDGRSFAMALNRKPELRPAVRFRGSRPSTAPYRFTETDLLRRRIWSGRTTAQETRDLAAKNSEPKVRLDAITALGRFRDAETSALLDRLWSERDPANPQQDPSGMPYFGTFRRAAVAFARVRSGERSLSGVLGRMRLSRIPFARESVALALAANADDAAIPALQEIVDRGESSEAEFALTYLGHLDRKARPIWMAGLNSIGVRRRNCVMQLAQFHDAKAELEALAKKGNAGARLALEWQARL